MSIGLMPAAPSATSAWPAPAWGSGTSSRRGGSPRTWIAAARMRRSVDHAGVPDAPPPPFAIDPAVAGRFPGLRVLAVTAGGVRNGPSDERSRAWLRAAEEAAQALHPSGRAADHPHVAAWRAAYS